MQLVKYLNSQDFLSKKEKYTYSRSIRAQLSTSEQLLLFFNSLTSLGWRWELFPDEENPSFKGEIDKLISDYHLIKNVPGRSVMGIRYQDYYPKVNYEYLIDNTFLTNT